MARAPRISASGARVSRANKVFSEDGVVFKIAIDNVIDFLAAGDSFTEVMKDPRYLDAIVDEAFEKADDRFNQGAAAFAATGAIAHMYEWGTQGVNKGRTNVRMDPMNPAARLWHNYCEGAGLNRTIWFAFRPSVANVPKPTVAETGMSSEVINQMNNHVFRWKARVMENGEEVTIARRSAKFLLIPATEENRPYMRNYDIKRGYALSKGPINTMPGYKVYAGNFTKFWMKYWQGLGYDIIEGSIEKQILSDYIPEFRTSRNAGTLRPVNTVHVAQEMKAESKNKKVKILKKANARRARKT
jgi:hypothetical protein